jgi:hypothetical protein
MLSSLIVTLLAAAIADPPRICSASFSDVGIFGGLEMSLSASGDLWIRHVYPPGNQSLRERRYHVTLDAVQPGELGRRVAAVEFLKLKDSSRKAIPDEPSARISVTTCGKPTFAVRQYVFDANARFWVVMDWFLIQWEAVKATEPIYDGPVDHTWRPPTESHQEAPDTMSQQLPNNKMQRTKRGQDEASPLILVLSVPSEERAWRQGSTDWRHQRQDCTRCHRSL